MKNFWKRYSQEYGERNVIRLRESEFEDIVRYIRENYGINLDKKQVLIECRLSRELEKRGFVSYGK